MKKSKIYKYKGFTLVELVIIIVIIGILVGVSISLFSGGNKRAKNAVRDSDIRTIVSSARSMKISIGRYPINSVDFHDNAVNYISEIPSDPDSGRFLGSLGEPLPSYVTQEYTYSYYDPPQNYSDDRVLASTHFEGDNAAAQIKNINYGRKAMGTMWGPDSQIGWTMGTNYSVGQTNAGTILLRHE